MSESIVLCEGFHDRAFWAGWLTHLGCSDEGYRPGTSGYPQRDPWGDPVRGGGQFAYRSRSGAFIRVRPCGGRTKILTDAEVRLRDRALRPVSRLVVTVDPDTSVSAAGPATGLRAQDVERFIQANIDPAAVRGAAGEVAIDGGAAVICLVRWEVNEPPNPAVPDTQTLERLTCCALAAAFPARGQNVGSWLASRSSPPLTPDPKEHAWSYMAGWYAEHGCDFFYRHLWSDLLVARELETRLRATGAWQVAEALAQ
jgi:hypothetical protein